MSLDSASLPVYAPSGDHQSALAGAFLAEGELSVNISTGSQTSLLAQKFEPGDHQTRPFFDGRFLNTVTHIPAGRALNVLLGFTSELALAQGLALGDPWPVIQQAVAAVSESDLAVDLAFFPSPVGERGANLEYPRGQPDAGGSCSLRPFATWPITIMPARCASRPTRIGSAWSFPAAWPKSWSGCAS